MALGKRRLAPQPRSLEELANLAEAWADLAERHRWSGDAGAYAQAAGHQLRERASRIRELLQRGAALPPLHPPLQRGAALPPLHPPQASRER